MWAAAVSAKFAQRSHAGAAKIIADETRWSHRLLAVMMDGLIAIDVATSLDLKP